MSVIQKIRDKYARIAVIAIALALLGFILTDYFSTRNRGGSRETTIGKINGKKIDADVFMKRVNEITKRQQNAEGENATAQVVNQLWQEQITNTIMDEQYDELGVTVTDRELDQILFGPHPPQEFLQYFGDPQNPQNYDPGMARQRYNQVKKSGTPEDKAFLGELIDYIEKQALMNKYVNLLLHSTYIPKWFLDKRNVDNSQMAKAAFVSVPYTTIADSAAKVSDAEINDYVEAHKKDFELKEENRSISYVSFSAAPSSGDSAKVRNELIAAKDSFQATNNIKEFMLRHNNVQYNDAWVSAKDLPLQNADTVFKAPVGAVMGPLVEPGYFIMTKIVDKKTQPDTVKVRHILIGTIDPQSRQQTRDSVTAKHIADSVQRVIAAGANFDSVAAKVSDDPGSKLRGGVYDSITRQTPFVPEFKDFAFNKPVGSKGIIKTDFGYHYIEVLSQRGSSQVYKIAVMASPIEASTETVNQANNEATMFAGNAKDEKSFNDYYEKNLKSKGYQKLVASNLRPMDFNITGVQGSARELIKEVFKADRGDVLNPVNVNNAAFVVAVVTGVEKPGLPSANSVRMMIEPILRNRKKAEMIKKQMGTVSDLNAVATKFNQQVQPADSLRFSGGGPLGYESKVIGAIFNPDNKGKVCREGIAGQAGVYAIRTDAVSTIPVENANIEEQRKMLEMQSRQMFRNPLEALQKRATIKDYRDKFY